MSPHTRVPFMRWCIPFMLVAVVSCGGGSGNSGTGNSGTGNSGTGNSGTGSGSASTGAGGSTGSAGTASTGSGTASTGSGTASTGSGTASTGSGTASTGSGTASTSGSSSGTVADAGPVCSNTDKTILPIDATGFVERACDDYQIQGAWYCYADGVGTSDCVTGKTPYVAASTGMCLSGMISTATGSYGAGLGLELNSSGGMASVKSAYDATANNVVGFEITITGSSGGIGLRLGFTGSATPGPTQPFVELPGAGTYQVLLADTLVPASFAGTTANTRANPAAIYDLQLAIPASAPVSYNYCITEVKPILAANAPTVPTACATPTAYGNAVCAPQDILGEVTTLGQTSLYAVQNNVNVGGTPECVQAMAGGTCAGFTATLQDGALMGSNVQSYPSIIYGWQAGSFYGGYRTAVQLQNITSVPTKWSFTTPPGGGGNLWDAAYDIWFAPTAAPATAAGGVELMVWQNYSGMQPDGGQTTTKTIAGAQYQVWTGTVNTWRYIAYRAAAPNSNPVNFDLINFFKDAETENVTLSGSSYLLGIQAGFEVTSLPMGSTMSTNSFSVSVVP
jgi:hypothetical protein